MANRSDNFTRADSTAGFGTPSDGGSAWVTDVGTSGIISNSGYFPSLVSSQGYAYLESNSNIGSASVKLNGVVDSGLIIRYIDQGNFIAIVATPTLLRIVTKSGNTFAFPSDTATTINSGDVLNVTFDTNNLITAKINGTTVSSLTTSLNSTGTKVGLRSGNTGNRFNTFSFVDSATGGTNLVGTSNSTSTISAVTSDSAKIIGDSSSFSTITGAISSLTLISLVGTSLPDYGNPIGLFDSLLINATDLLYIDASNNLLATNPSVLFDSLLINATDLLYIDASNNLLATNQIQLFDSLLINATDNLLIDSIGNRLSINQNAIFIPDNPSNGVLLNSMRIVGQMNSNSSAYSSAMYNYNLVGLSIESTPTLTDFLLINTIDKLLTDSINSFLSSGIVKNYATIVANYFGIGTSNSSTNAFYVASNTLLSYIGSSVNNSTISASATYLNNYVGQSISPSSISSTLFATAKVSGQSFSTTIVNADTNYTLSFSSALTSNSTAAGFSFYDYSGSGLSQSSTAAFTTNNSIYTGVGTSNLNSFAFAPIIGKLSYIGNSSTNSQVTSSSQFSTILNGQSSSTTTIASVISGLYNIVGLSIESTTINSVFSGLYGLIGNLSTTSIGTGGLSATFSGIGLMNSNSTINATLAAKSLSIGTSLSNNVNYSTINGLYLAKATSNSNTSAYSSANYQTYLKGNSNSSSYITSYLYAPINYTGTSISNNINNGSMDARTSYKGISTSTNTINSTFAYSYKSSGKSYTNVVAIGKFKGLISIVGSVTPSFTIFGKIGLLGVSSPQEQLVLSNLLLNNPDRKVKALKQSTFISLNRADFF